jgi:hypothetical protein
MKATNWMLAVKLSLIALIAGLTTAHPAFADASGVLNEANCSGGGFTLTATSITWLPAGTVAGTGCIDTGIGTDLTYSGGTLGPGNAGNIKNLTAGGGAIDQFMTFQGTTLDFVLTALGPGVSDTDCAGATTIGATCSPFVGSPFVLTNLGGGKTLIGLGAAGTITDGGDTSDWFGSFSTQINLTPGQIQTDLLSPGGSISSTQSGQFTVGSGIPVTSMPEPGTTGLLLTGLASLLLFARRKRKAELSVPGV